MASSSSSPCAACKFLRRKCLPECVFAPYFPPDSPQKFASVHKVFGASNVSKLLNELHPSRREDAVNSLAYEAEARLSDPVYGCVGVISILQHQLKQLQADLIRARAELCSYMASAGITDQLPTTLLQAAAYAAQQHQSSGHHMQYQQHSFQAPSTLSDVGIGLGLAGGAFREGRQHQQMVESQQLAVTAPTPARAQLAMMSSYDHGNLGRLDIAAYEHGAAAGTGGGCGLGLNGPSTGFMSQLLPLRHHLQQQHASDGGGGNGCNGPSS